MKESLNLQSPAKNLDQVTTESSYAMPQHQDISPGDLAKPYVQYCATNPLLVLEQRLKRLP